MWIALFVIALAASLCLSVAAILMRGRDVTKPESSRLSSEDASPRTKPLDPDLNTLLASAEVQAVMCVDHVDKGELLAELDAISAQLRKNAGPVVTFDRAVHRLRNMSQMMDRLGYDAATLARTDLNVGSVFRACQICPAEELCRHWLARAPASFARAPAFCPNADRFADPARVAA
jgi:Family of unknown function (DUF6455)